MDLREQREKQSIINWLNTEVTPDTSIFECILGINDEIITEINNNNLNLRYGENTLLINLIYYLYYNSYTKIIN